MNTVEFEKVVNDQLNKCKDVMIEKAKQYADNTNDDRLHNFKIAATLQNCTPVAALAGMMCKHTVSVYDLIQQHNNGATISAEMWDEKITDSINYLLLLKAAVTCEK